MRHYLDHASTSPLRPAALVAMTNVLGAGWGDPSRVHSSGLAARAALEDARDRVAAALGARPREVVFTSGASEAIAAACWGAAERGHHQVVPAVEHSAVRESAGCHGPLRLVAVDGTGTVDVDAFVDGLDADTALAHCQWANHEVGTIQPIARLVGECRARNVLVHVDAAQAVGHVPVDLGVLGADLVSVSGHKFGGPAGIGALVIRRGLRLRPMIVGGEQERLRRAGLENVAAAVGMAAALDDLDVAAESAVQDRHAARLRAGLTAIDGVTVVGHPDQRVPHVVCAVIADVEPQAVLFGLDRAGIDAHAGSVCASTTLEPSPVLEAMGVDAHRSLRLSVGWSSTDADVDTLLAALPPVLAELRALR